jgi:uncharacterized membrane protein YvlD (DUF360 family)
MSQPRAGLRPVWRVLVVWIVSAATLLLLAWVLPGFSIDGAGSAFAAAALLGVLNALVWPVLVRLALPLTVLTLGLAPLALNAAVVGLVARALPGVTLDGFWWGVAVTAGLTAVTMILNALLALDDDDVVLRNLSRYARGQETSDANSVPGVLFLQVDGLALAVLQRAVRDGNAPTLAGWLQRGSHRLTGWTTDWSSQTGASQAGILLGSNEDMPAFRWLEKDTGTLFVSNRPRHAADIERRQSTGKGLLYADGASRGNIFTGDAADAVLTMASAGRKRGRIGAGYYAYFSHPYAAMHTLLGVIADSAREVHQAAVQRRRDVQPRVHRGGVYPLLRSFTTVLTRDVIVATLVGDMRAGRSVVYADFVGYDEVAHHSGVERYDALETLRRLDREFARLERAAASSARQYEFVVLSDHGQSQGATFRTRYGQTLEDVVKEAIGAPATSPSAADASEAAGQESWGYAGGALEEIAAGPGMAARAVSKVSNRHRAAGGDVLLGPESAATTALPEQRRRTAGDEAPTDEATVLASGNCGLVYLTREPNRMSRERIDELYPALLPALRAHPGIGFLLVRSEQRGPLALSSDGELELASGALTGTDPLAGFGAHARRQVGRTDTFTHCPDIMVNSLWDEQTGEVAAFEELVGSHGGMGGEQTHPFVLYPSAWSAPDGDLFGAEAVHRQFRRWLADLGHTAYDDASSVDEAVNQSEEAPMAEVHDRSPRGGAGSC